MSERDSIILPISSPNTQSKPSLSVNDTPLRRLFVLVEFGDVGEVGRIRGLGSAGPASVDQPEALVPETRR